VIQFLSHVRAPLLEGIRYLSLFLSLHPRADAISDEGVAFSADPLSISNEGVAFSAAFQANGVAFPTTGTGLGCISSERGHIFYPRRPRMCPPVGLAGKMLESIRFQLKTCTVQVGRTFDRSGMPWDALGRPRKAWVALGRSGTL